MQGSVNVGAAVGRKRDPFVRQGHAVRIAARQEVEVGSAPARGLVVVHPHDLRPAGLEGLVADRHAQIDKAHLVCPCEMYYCAFAPEIFTSRPICRARS